MIKNRSSNETCPPCDDTGLVILAGTYRIGKRIMQPQATSCMWCEAGAEKDRRYGTMSYTSGDIEAPSPEPDTTDPRTAKKCKEAFTEWQRSFRAMQKASREREGELRRGAKQVPITTPPAEAETAKETA